MYWVGQKSITFFFCMIALAVLRYLQLYSKQFCLYCDSCHCIVTAVIVACIKKTSKLVNFCITIFILKMEENTQHFWHIILYYFKKGKNSTETHTQDVRSVQLKKEKVLWPVKCVKSGCEVSWYQWHFGPIILCGGAVLCIGRCLAATQPLPTRSQQQEIADILKISKSIKLLVKMKNVRLFGQPSIYLMNN